MSTRVEMFRDIGSAVQRIDPHEAASDLDEATIHLWWLRRTRAEGRAPLLRVLAAYLGVPVAHVALRAGTHGRPELAGALAGRLDFNWSHSRDSAVLAIARKLPRLGVDIEYLRVRRPYMHLAQRYFGANEHAGLMAMPSAERATGFVRLWTAKEAILKADGRGLAHGLDRVLFTVHGSALRLRSVDGAEGDCAAWQFARWHIPDAGFVTLCWHGETRTIRHFALVLRHGVAAPDEIIS